MLMFTTTVMNAVSLAVLLAPASSFFVWANWATAGMALASAGAIVVVLPTTSPRFEFDERMAKASEGVSKEDSLTALLPGLDSQSIQ